jgi:threonine/homoserine/homoserine lactone efflux protein
MTHKIQGKEKKERIMKLTPPKAVTFWVSILFVVIGVALPYLLAQQPNIDTIGLVLVVVGFVLLACGNMLKKL